MVRLAKDTFVFAYDNYMEHAFPADELNPIDCNGRGPDLVDRSNININDVLGNYSLTLVDTLDTLLVMGNYSEFKHAVKLVVDNVTFDQDSIVQVFEATIRVIGGLLSAHLLIIDKNQLFGTDIRPSWYNDELIHLARDLALRLLPAFEQSSSGIPYPRVHLREGVPNSTICQWCRTETCPAGAGSLLLEFGILSRILNDDRYEFAAKRAIENLWIRRSKTGLFGNAIDAESSEWIGEISGIGAGIDSFIEYLLKAGLFFGDKLYLEMFDESYGKIQKYVRKGRAKCNSGSGVHPLYMNVNMHNGNTMTNWIDSLSAAWAGLQVLSGDIEESICTHVFYYSIWRRFGFLPERFNWQLLEPELSFYPLRPELAESTYFLYQATKNPFYFHVGRDILESINKHTRSKCGYATVHDVRKKNLEDRMESFFLSETVKYLYLLFDTENPLNKHSTHYMFSTQGHIFPMDQSFRTDQSTIIRANQSGTNKVVCDRINEERRFLLPIKNNYFVQLSHLFETNQ
ncbi:hypothetical protein RDWZM_006711 [Blomia tropicalis]|uniref:alpha-1,2-Mannosidase n=1 Tax=Blomia tropicalis TaxID=40697 RepID=A0A9Q0RNL5_BLOTA|nr:hypothetical protein RDWZM_006711 [Blomia tropicalis]